MALVTYRTACTEKRLIARDVWEFRCEKPEGFAFKPGQFILFRVPLIENPDDVQTRAFSIASAPFEKDLLFVAKMIPGGRASRWIAEWLRESSVIEFQGPFGNFLLDRATDKDYLFLATSTGIAPFRSMLLQALSEKDARRMDLVLGVKEEEDLFWLDEIGSMAKEHRNLFFHPSLTAPGPSWTGHKGRVQAVAEAISGNDFTKKNLYVCGNPAMTTDVKKLALEGWRMDKKDLHVEGYI